VFLDTNIILAYAIDFEEDNHKKAVTLFHGSHTRFTAIRVKSELGKIKRRRAVLYNDLDQFLGADRPVSEFNPSVQIKSNDKKHLSQLLTKLSNTDKQEILKLFRKMRRIIDQQITIAFSMIARPLIPISSDLSGVAALGTLINNQSDVEILIDALCWAENNKKRTIIFCTVDWTDVLGQRTAIYAKICSIRGCTTKEIPLEIRSLQELIKP